jgi:hypothetical protein
MFQQIANSLNKKDDKGFQVKTTILATIIQMKSVEYSQTTGKPKQGLLLRTYNGEESWVNLMGKDCPIDQNLLNTQCEFLIWPYKAEQSPKVTFYCWINRRVSQNSLPQAPQTTNSAPQGQSVPNNKDVSMCRQCAGKCSAVILGNKVYATAMDALTDMMDLSVPLSDWFLTGNLPKLFTPDPDKSGYGVPNTSAEDDGIPFP